MLIALIDDGIVPEACGDLRLEYDLIVEADGVIRLRRAKEPVLTNHGTTCAQIIHKYAPDAQLCSLGIFQDPKCKTSVGKLTAALDWCRGKRILMIHMSIGTTWLCDDPPIQSIVLRILQQGQIIVAAHSNQPQRYTVPACYSGVLGVAADPELQGQSFRVADAFDLCGVQIFASSRHDLSEYPGGCKETIVSNSYAAPVITARVHKLLQQAVSQYMSTSALYRKLADRTISISRLRPDFLTSAIVFDPACQLRQSDCLGFELLGHYAVESEFLAAIACDPRSPVAVVPSGSLSSAFLNTLCEASLQRLGIVYAGAAPADLREKVPCIFWDESIYQLLLTQLQTRLIDAGIAIIWVKPQCDGALRLLSNLKKRFFEEGYGCVAISDFPLAYLYGFEYLPEGCSLNKLVSYLGYTYSPDVIICSVAQDNGLLSPDMRITFEGGKSAVYSEDKVDLPINPTDADMEELFLHLMEE